MDSEPKAIRIPTPVGGTPIGIDAAPSIVFAVAYAALIPFIILRISRPGMRSILQIGTTIFAIERVVVYSLRASQAFNASSRTSGGLLVYLQLSFSQGYITLAVNAVPLIRALLVDASGTPDTLEPNNPQVRDPKDDRPRMRFWVRRATDVLNYAFPAATVPNFVQASKYKEALKKQDAGDTLMANRYTGTAIALVLIIILAMWAGYAYARVANVRRNACLRLLVLLGLTVPVCVYRLAVMHNTIPDLLSTGPGSQESTSSKALFYVLHCLPEWLAAALLVIPNTRKYFNTGPWGDWRSFDGQKGCTETRKEAKEKKERERAERQQINSA